MLWYSSIVFIIFPVKDANQLKKYIIVTTKQIVWYIYMTHWVHVWNTVTTVVIKGYLKSVK